MSDSIRAAGVGLRAQENRVDVISDNIANIGTTGFKSSRPEFSDLLREKLPYGNAEARDNTVGTGAAMVATSRDDSQGVIETTGRSLDVAINGSGFFAVRNQNGQTAYTRDGSFQTDRSGRLVTADGSLIVPQITVPKGATEVSISGQGQVSAKLPSGQIQALGQIQLATFANDNGLSSIGQNQFLPTLDSGAAVLKTPGKTGAGTLQQGALEQSNADLANEMAQLIDAERSFGMLGKTVSTADSMDAITNEITG